MSAVDPRGTRLLSDCIMTEISRLSEQQNIAMQQAAFIGMTESEAKEYNERAGQIRELVEQLTMMYPRRMSTGGRQHGQEAQETTRYGRESH